MDKREFAKSLIDQIPEWRLVYVIHFLLGASIPDIIPDKQQEVFDGINN